MRYTPRFTLRTILFFSFIFTRLFAHELNGIISDSKTGNTIPDANITLLETGSGTASRDGGYYVFDNLNSGSYTVKVSVIGYEISITNVDIQKNVVLNIELLPHPIELSPVSVTATLTEHLVSELPHSTEVLSSQRLESLNGNTPGEKLESLTGIFSNTYDGLSGLQTPSIRGSNGDQVVVLMDGIRLNTAQGGGVDLNLFPASALNKIEVVRGAHSAILGSDAVGGAIHLQSKNAVHSVPFKIGLNTTMGSFGTQILQGYASAKRDKLSLFVAYNQMQSDGNFEYIDQNTGNKDKRLNNDYKGNNVFAKAGFDWKQGQELQLLFQSMNTKKGAAGSTSLGWDGMPMLTPLARSAYDRQLISLISKNRIGDKFHLKTQLSRQQFDYAFTNPAGWTAIDDLHKNGSTQIFAHGEWTPTHSISLLGGFEHRNDELKSTQIIAENRKLNGAFFQADINAALPAIPVDVTVIPALRYDSYSDVEAQMSPQIGVLLTTSNLLRWGLKANIGKAYRVPTFNDLYWPADDYTRGNPDLKPESSFNRDIGLQIAGGSIMVYQAEFTYFSNDVEDLINWAPTPENEFQWMPSNVGKASLSGVETAISLALPNNKLSLRIAHTRLNATDETEGAATQGKTLIYRPKDKVDVTAGAELAGVFVNVNYRSVAKRFVTGDNSSSLDGYTLLNANVGTSVSFMGISINPKVQLMNLLDKSIFITNGYPIPGREYRISVGIEY